MFSTKYIITFLLFIMVIPTIAVAHKHRSYRSENLEYGSNADTSKTKKDSTQSSSPRDGKYLILSYGSNPANPLKLGYFILSANSYKYYDLENKLLGDGTYVYDVVDKQVKWQSGPFKAIGWSGDFSIDGNGKTHLIRLKNNTVGTNSGE